MRVYPGAYQACAAGRRFGKVAGTTFFSFSCYLWGKVIVDSGETPSWSGWGFLRCLEYLWNLSK